MAARNNTPLAAHDSGSGASPSAPAYWSQSARPLASLAFVVPMLVAYEGGLLLLGPQAMRNGADAWLRRFLETLGFGQYFLLPLLTCALLMAWHHLRAEPWWLPTSILRGMLVESICLGFLLLLVAQAHHAAFASVRAAWPCATTPEPEPDVRGVAVLLSYFGAGVYEELLFRLMLLPTCAWALFRAGASPRASLASAVILSSLLFSIVHYEFHWTLGPHTLWANRGDEFDVSSFLFRALAGAFFGAIFLRRGFGIAAGSHAVYDIFASML